MNVLLGPSHRFLDVFGAPNFVSLPQEKQSGYCANEAQEQRRDQDDDDDGLGFRRDGGRIVHRNNGDVCAGETCDAKHVLFPICEVMRKR